jgi:hypothetical protein
LGGGELKSSAQTPVDTCGLTNGASSEEGGTRVTGLLLYTGDESLESLHLRALRSCLLVAVAAMAGSLCAPSIQWRNCRTMSITICFRIHFATLIILQPTSVSYMCRTCTLYPRSNVHYNTAGARSQRHFRCRINFDRIYLLARLRQNNLY